MDFTVCFTKQGLIQFTNCLKFEGTHLNQFTNRFKLYRHFKVLVMTYVFSWSGPVYLLNICDNLSETSGIPIDGKELDP